MASFRDILQGIKLAKYIPQIVALITKFRQTISFADNILDRIQDAADGKADFVMVKGSAEAKRVHDTLRRLHDLTNRIEGDGL